MVAVEVLTLRIAVYLPVQLVLEGIQGLACFCLQSMVSSLFNGQSSNGGQEKHIEEQSLYQIISWSW